MTANLKSWSPGLCPNKSLNLLEPTVPPHPFGDPHAYLSDGPSTSAACPTFLWSRGANCFALSTCLDCRKNPVDQSIFRTFLQFSHFSRTPRNGTKSLDTNVMRSKRSFALLEKNMRNVRKPRGFIQLKPTEPLTSVRSRALSRTFSAAPPSQPSNCCTGSHLHPAQSKCVRSLPRACRTNSCPPALSPLKCAFYGVRSGNRARNPRSAQDQVQNVVLLRQ